MYLAWGAYYEGNTDKAYFDFLIAKAIDELLLSEGTFPVSVPDVPAVYLNKSGRSIDEVAQEICVNKDVFHIIFIHADAGGRNIERNINERRESFAQAANRICEWRMDRCVMMSPRREMEAWALADPDAVLRALGYNGSAAEIGLPTGAMAAEQLPDPEAVLNAAAKIVSPRRFRMDATELLTKIAQEQSLGALRGAESFREFEGNLRTALQSLGCLPVG